VNAQVPYSNTQLSIPVSSNLKIVPGARYLSGYTLYRLNAIGVINDGDETKVALKSELKFPLSTWLAGGHLQYIFPISKRRVMSINGGIYTNISDGTGRMNDQDWIDDIQIGFTKARQSNLEMLHTNITLKYQFLNTGYSEIYLLGNIFYQRLNFENTGYWGWVVNYYSNILYEVQGTKPTVNYKVQYLNPQLGLGFRFPILQSVLFELESSAGITIAKDEDDHLLRSKLSKGDAIGFSTFSTFKLHFTPFNLGKHSIFLNLYGDLQYIYAKGEQRQEWYANMGQPAGTIIEEIPYQFESLQYAFGINIGLNLNLSGKYKSSYSFPAERSFYRTTEQSEEIGYELTGNKLTIKWRPVENAMYNIYGRPAGAESWVKLNKVQMSENYITFKKTQLEGRYQFKVIIYLKDGYSIETKILNVVFKN
jgi:hypothetical protein